jgi:hypothetical protein
MTSDSTRHWRAWEAKKVGAELEKLLVNHDLAGQLGTIFGGHLAGDILKSLVIWELTGGKVEDWIEDFAGKLTACANELQNHQYRTKSFCGQATRFRNFSRCRLQHGVNI